MKTTNPVFPQLEEVGPLAPTFRRIASRTVILTREQALEAARAHKALPHCPCERPLQPARVKALVERTRAGLLLSLNWATVLYKGVRYGSNGQHTSEAIIQAADFLPETIVIHFDDYEAYDAPGVGTLFEQFDARLSTRTKNDVAGAYQGIAEPLAGVSRRKGKLALDGIAWFLRTVEKAAVPSGDLLYREFLTEAYHPFIRWLDRLLSPKTKELEHKAVVASMYHTFITSESGAQEFWPHVAKNDLAKDTDPRNVLSQELVRPLEQKGTTPMPAPMELYAKCIKAWNAFRGGEEIRSLNVNPKKGPPPIAA